MRGSCVGRGDHCTVRLYIIPEGDPAPEGSAVKMHFKRAGFKTMKKMVNSRSRGKEEP